MTLEEITKYGLQCTINRLRNQNRPGQLDMNAQVIETDAKMDIGVTWSAKMCAH